MRERRYSPAENITREQLKLKEGEAYTLIFIERPEEGGKMKRIKKRMRLIKCYRHHAVFEDAKGMQHSYRYWDIWKLLSGEPR